jgi:hypothetical protein
MGKCVVGIGAVGGLGSEVVGVGISAVLVVVEVAVAFFLSGVHNCFSTI